MRQAAGDSPPWNPLFVVVAVHWEIGIDEPTSRRVGENKPLKKVRRSCRETLLAPRYLRPEETRQPRKTTRPVFHVEPVVLDQELWVRQARFSLLSASSL